MLFKTKIQCFYTGEHQGKIWFDVGANCEFTNAEIDAKKWILDNAHGAHGAIVTVTIEINGQIILADQRSFFIVKESSKNTDLFDFTFRFDSETMAWFNFGIESDAKLIDIAPYSASCLNTLLEISLITKNKDLFMDVTSLMKGGE